MKKLFYIFVMMGLLSSPAHAVLLNGGGVVIAGLQACTTDATKAASNHTLIQAALNLTGDIYIATPGTYCNDSKLLISSNTRFSGVPGVKILNIAGVNDSVMQNTNWATTGDTNIFVSDIIFDGNGANQTVGFATIDLQFVKYVRFDRDEFDNALRTGTYPTNVGNNGEGITIRQSQWVWVSNAFATGNTYDGYKTRSSDDIFFTNIASLDNGKCGIQISYNSATSTATSGPSHRVHVDGISVYSTTGVPNVAASETCGVYFHGAESSTITNVSVYGTQAGFGAVEYNVNNSVSNAVVYYRDQVDRDGVHNGAITFSPGGIGTPFGHFNNTYSNIVIAPISGASGNIMNLSDDASNNTFSNINFTRASGTGTWVFNNNGTKNQFYGVNAPNASFSDTGSGTIFSAFNLYGSTTTNSTRTSPEVAAGSKFTASGCSNATTTGGAAAGSFASGTTGTCTVVVTMGGATGSTASNGWACKANDLTTPADTINQTASSTTTATLSGTTVSGDIINFSCIGY